MQNVTPAPELTANQPHLVDAAQCAAVMNIPKSTLYRMLDEGLPVYRIGKRRRGCRFSIAEVLAWLRGKP